MNPFHKPKKHPHDIRQPILALRNITVQFGQALALHMVSFQLQKAERVAIVGPNGAGKSTLFNVIAGLLSPTDGEVKIYGHAPSHHTCIAYVPQRNEVDWQFPVNVADVVMMGRVGRLGLFNRPKKADWEYVYQSLDLVGMANFAKRQIGELSGGQQQRVFIARALAQEAELVLMDEPLNGLDINSQADILDILKTLSQREVTVMITTHDLNAVVENFDRVMLLNQRVLAFGSAEHVLTPILLNQAYQGRMQLVKTKEGTIVIHPNLENRHKRHTHV